MRLLRYGALLLWMIELSARFSMTITQMEWGVVTPGAGDASSLGMKSPAITNAATMARAPKSRVRLPRGTSTAIA